MSRSIEYPKSPRGDELVVSDGEPTETARHHQQMMILIESLELAWHDRDDFYVGGDMFLYFSETQSRRNDFRGPDVFVTLNTTRRERLAWVVWEEDGRAPDVIIELLSPKTEHIDRGEKMRIYGRTLKVGEYFLFDPFSGVLEGYELAGPRGGYRRKAEDGPGRIACEQLGLFLGKVRSTFYGVDVNWLRWLDQDGRPLPMPIEHANAAVARANAEAARANALEQRADALEQRADALAAELAELKAKLERG